MVQYQGSWESIFSPSSCKHLASLSLAQHYWGVQTCRRNAKSQTVCFQGPKNDFGGTKQNFIHPCKHFRWPQLRRSAKQNFQPKWGSKTWFKIMVQYQGPRESIFSPPSCKHLASLSLAQHYWGVQAGGRNAKSQTVCFQGPKNELGAH